MVPKINVIYDFDEFIVELRELYELVEKAMELRRNEYKQIGWNIPARIKFEEVDLRNLTKRMLSVHKTLQSTAHSNSLNRKIHQDDARKARLVAIAGICEFIKEEFVGKFWDAHRRVIDWGPDNTVYDWIWEKGFKEAGIPLIRSEFRREFVQTLVLESGVPKNRIRDIIDFFVIYWRYLRNIKDVEHLIELIIKGEQSLANIPPTDRSRIAEICRHAADFTKAFALAISKLSKIFKFIEDSDELFHGEIEDYENLIFSKTGINPLEILRDKDQIKQIYRLILGVITPQKLERILQTKPIGTKVRTPDCNTIRVDTYKEIQYGEHLLDGARFTCVPNTCLQLSELQNLPYNSVIQLGTGVLLKSKSKIRVTVNGRSRTDLVLGLYAHNFIAHVFYIEQQPAMVISLRTEDGTVNTKLTAPEGFQLNSYLHYSGNFKKNIHSISVNISSCRIMASTNANSCISLVSDISLEPLAIINLDSEGQGYCSERLLPLTDPSPQAIRLRVKNETDDPLCINGKAVESFCNLSIAMLFSPYYGRELTPSSSSFSTRYGGKKFVLFTADGDSGVLSLFNLNVAGTAIVGDYTVKILNWDDTKQPCKIVYESENNGFFWSFEKCIHFTLYIRKVKESKPCNLLFDHLQSESIEDFEITINPFPSKGVQDKLIWGITVNNMEPIAIPFCNGPAGIVDGPSLRLSGVMVSKLASLAGYNPSVVKNAIIDLSLGIQDHVFSHVKLWVFSDVVVSIPDNLSQGSDVYADVRIGTDYFGNVSLKDSRGRNKVRSQFNYKDGIWEVVEQRFYGKMDLEKFGTCLEISVIPIINGFRFGNIDSGVVEFPRDLMKRELSSYDLLILSDKMPQVTVNDKPFRANIVKYDNFHCLNLSSIKRVTESENTVICSVKEHQISFKVLDRLSVISAEFHHHLVNGCIHGIISYSGPVGSTINVAVFRNPNDSYDMKVAEFISSCDGTEKLNIPLEIPVNVAGINLEEEFYVRLYLKESSKTPISKAHIFGESWHVHLESEEKESNYEYLVARANQAIESGKVFFANRCIEAAMNLAPCEDFQKLSALKKCIDSKLNVITFKSLAVQTTRILKKEFLIDFE